MILQFLQPFNPITVGSIGSSHSCRGGGFFPIVDHAVFNKCLDNGKVIDEITSHVVEILVQCGFYLIFNHIFRMYSMAS